MESLLLRQQDLIESINKIERNFGKDSSSRKTRRYLDDRLDQLDRVWAEFQANNDKLARYTNDIEPYFAENQFDAARKYFNTVRANISSFPPASETAPLKATSPIPSKLKVPTIAEQAQDSLIKPVPSTSKNPLASQQPTQADDLLSLQRTNFRAFYRLVRSIQVDQIQDKWELEDELRNLQTRWSAIDSLHLKIDNFLQGSDEAYDDEFFTYEKTYRSIKREINLRLAATAHIQHSTPQVEIPIFTGRYNHWPNFYDLFSESIHNNTLITKCQKMQHLKGKLRGEAERLIQHLNITNDNYDTAWELLTHRYNNPQLLFNNQIETFLNQPTINKQSAYDIKHLYDTSMECIYAIQNLGINTSTWDPILVHLIAKKMDIATYADYKEARTSPRDLPSLSELMKFLEAKFTALEPLQKKERDATAMSSKLPYQKSYSKPQYQPTKASKYGKCSKQEYKAVVTTTITCPVCEDKHFIFKCSKFLKLSAVERLQQIIKLQACQNCLRQHIGTPCNSSKTCKVCQSGHNTLLHDALSNNDTRHVPENKTSSQVQRNEKKHSVNHVATHDEEILLATLLINIKSVNGTYITLRALLDQGSQISLISEKAAQLLGLPRERYHASVSGIGHGSKTGRGIVTLQCQSTYDEYYTFATKALVIRNVVNSLPNQTFEQQAWPHLQHIQLADPDYNVSKPIDLLLDASVYSNIIMSGLMKGPNRAPIAQQTQLGWILSGNVKTFNCHVVINNLADISQYWELEEISHPSPSLTSEEQYCEDIYQSTTRRTDNGRYEVAIPMKPGYEQYLGQSKSKAIAQFHNLEKRLTKNHELSESYKQFMLDYEQQQHMMQVTIPTSILACYLPHHGVMKLDSTTTKLRTVFNASSKTSTGYSLNDLMERGPNLQKDLQHLILVWRQHKYVITADIQQMFRQILIRPQDRPLQRIVWRTSPHELLKEYELSTVSYGTKSAPYLAMRTLIQLAADEKDNYPLAAKALSQSFYMDDLLEGGDTIEHTTQIQQQLIDALKGAGMNIRKWSSNARELTEGLTENQVDSPLDFKCSETRKTLGLHWNPNSDTFSFDNKEFEESSDASPTKRQLLSHISTIFDPLGWLSPLTIRAKLLFQRTWTENLEWDSCLSEDINRQWKQLKQDLQSIKQFEIPRYFGQNISFQLHGFCDASEKAYACAVYIITRNNKGENTSKLVIAKTKLAPLRNKLSLPRLELCGAVLLARLMHKVMETFNTSSIQTYAWTDSMVVLGWIHGDISRWKQFVANRVRSLLDILPASHWHHVKSEENAADCATRGLTSLKLAEHTLWWEGPQWLLSFDATQLSKIQYEPTSIEVKKHHVNTALHRNENVIITLLNNCSSIRRITTTIGWLSRYTRWLRNKQSVPKQGHLTSEELQSAHNVLIRVVQHSEFEEDINRLEKQEKLKKSSNLSNLQPFIDDNGLLRVGGRLRHSPLSQSAKHPIVLSSHSKLTDLVIQQAHATSLHGGPSLTLSYIRETYWIISGLRTVKRELRKCIRCRRFSTEKQNQIMADLPKPRVTPSRPFTHTGVDFTGYFDIKTNKGRGVRTNKGYVVVFVCLSTKAVHLELASDLSTPVFLAAFHRFCARRGTPNHMYSDNGTNFIGADKLLKKECQAILQNIDQTMYKKNDYNIQWHFNAPAHPSAGGLWEAAVKSFKRHLRRVIGEQKLTFEEFTTLLHQIEACLNSRPLCRLSENLEDEFLSPGHFLIGDSLLSRPQTDPEHINIPTRWHLIQALNKQFWRKWSSDYLQQLQTRTKWQTSKPNMAVNDIVLIRDENHPPGKWPMAKIIEVHPGPDGHVRVVSIKTKGGIMKRPIVKLTPLLTDSEQNQAQQKINNNQTLTYNNIVTTSSQSQTRGRRSVRKPFCYYISAALLLFMFLLTPGSCSHNISQIKKEQRFYFDKTCDISLIRDEWKLITYYNMSTYWSGITHVQSYVEHLQRYGMALPTQYQSIIYQLQHEITEIEHFNQLLTNPLRRRPKRGLINGIGYIANSLFGVLDDRFAQQYEKDIQKIAMNEDHLRKLLKNQTSVLESQYNILKRNEDIMNKQFRIVQQHLQDITNETNRIQNAANEQLYILSASLSAMIIISNLRYMQDSLIETITDLSHGHMGIHILPPEQLEQQLTIIYSHIQDGLTLPYERQSIQDLYKLMKTNVKIGTSFLIIEIKIPLVSSETFQLDKIISLPSQDSILEFVTPYIAFNLQKDMFLMLTEAEIQDCVYRSPVNMICSLNTPVYELKITHSICNLQIHNKTMCHERRTPCNEKWIRLHNNDTWLYSCCETCSVRIFCADSGMTMNSLSGNGLLQLGQGCTVKGDTFSIIGHNSYFSQINIRQTELRIPETSILNHIWNTTDIGTFNLENHDEEWHTMNEQIQILKQQADTSMTIHDVHQYSVLYTLLALVLVGVMLYIAVRRCKTKGRIRLSPIETTTNHDMELKVMPTNTLQEQAVPASVSRTVHRPDYEGKPTPKTDRLSIPNAS